MTTDVSLNFPFDTLPSSRVITMLIEWVNDHSTTCPFNDETAMMLIGELNDRFIGIQIQEAMALDNVSTTYHVFQLNLLPGHADYVTPEHIAVTTTVDEDVPAIPSTAYAFRGRPLERRPMRTHSVSAEEVQQAFDENSTPAPTDPTREEIEQGTDALIDSGRMKRMAEPTVYGELHELGYQVHIQNPAVVQIEGGRRYWCHPNGSYASWPHGADEGDRAYGTRHAVVWPSWESLAQYAMVFGVRMLSVSDSLAAAPRSTDRAIDL